MDIDTTLTIACIAVLYAATGLATFAGLLWAEVLDGRADRTD